MTLEENYKLAENARAQICEEHRQDVFLAVLKSHFQLIQLREAYCFLLYVLKISLLVGISLKLFSRLSSRELPPMNYPRTAADSVSACYNSFVDL
jgi:hypothetical protein